MTPSADGTFNWRDHVELDPHFTSQERQQVEAALDALSSYPDRRGQMLIEAGSQNQGHKIVMAPSRDRMFQSDGIIGVGFNELANLRFGDGDTARAPSLEASLEHELVHAAQAPLKSSYQRREIEENIAYRYENQSEPVPETDRAAFMAEVDVMLARAKGNALELLRPEVDTGGIRGGETDIGKLPVEQFPMLNRYAAAFNSATNDIDAELRTVDGTNAMEQQATQIVDETSRANRPNEPIRGSYDNAWRVDQPNATLSNVEGKAPMAALTGNIAEAPDAASAPAMPSLPATTSSPVVQEPPSPYAAALNGIDLSAFRASVATDGMTRSAAETGMLAQAGIPNIPSRDQGAGMQV